MEAVGEELRIGRRIRELRKERGWTQQELAERIGLKQKDVCTWENGVRIPTIPSLSKIAKAFGISIFEFWDDWEGA